MTAAEAQRLGLVNRVVPPGQALSGGEGPRAAHRRERTDRVPLRARSDPARRRDAAWRTASSYEATLFGLCAATEDMKEGMTAFLEKRPARFTGR